TSPSTEPSVLRLAAQRHSLAQQTAVESDGREYVGDLASGVSHPIRVRRLAALRTKRRIIEAASHRGINRVGVIRRVDHVLAAQPAILRRANIDGRTIKRRRFLDP